MPRTPDHLPPPLSRNRSAPPRSWQHRSSALSRYALLAYALIVIDASLFPFSGWRHLGIGPYEYLAAEWPQRALPFDLFVNALGYLPLGFVGGLAVHPRLRGLAMVVASVIGCVMLSVHLEALQTYLPARVASTVDVIANGIGALIGALLAARLAHPLLDTGRLRIWRTRWLAIDASRGIVLVVLWFGALIYPDMFAFGMGALLKAFDPERAETIALAMGLANGSDAGTTALRFQRAEAVVTALGLSGAGMLLLNLSRQGLRWPGRLLLVTVFVVTTLAVEIFAHAFLFELSPPWPPLTPGARRGAIAGAAVLLVGTMLPRRARWALGIGSLTAFVVLVNIHPDNPYGNGVSAAWTRGKLMNFYGLASGLNLIWPYLAIAYLLRHRGSSGKPRERRPNAFDRASTVGSSL